MEQAALLLSAKDHIPDAVLGGCKDFRAAIRLCIEVSGLERKELAYHLGIQDAHLSRMLADSKDEDQRHFPISKITKLMEVCGNEIPLRWLALSRGYGLFRLKSEVELENERLKAELSAQEAKLATIMEFMQKVKGV